MDMQFDRILTHTCWCMGIPHAYKQWTPALLASPDLVSTADTSLSMVADGGVFFCKRHSRQVNTVSKGSVVEAHICNSI